MNMSKIIRPAIKHNSAELLTSTAILSLAIDCSYSNAAKRYESELADGYTRMLNDGASPVVSISTYMWNSFGDAVLSNTLNSISTLQRKLIHEHIHTSCLDPIDASLFNEGALEDPISKIVKPFSNSKKVRPVVDFIKVYLDAIINDAYKQTRM